MNPKYTPATYFGAFLFVVNLIIAQKLSPGGLNGHTIIFALLGAAVGAIIGGFLFGIIWNWFKNRQAKN